MAGEVEERGGEKRVETVIGVWMRKDSLKYINIKAVKYWLVSCVTFELFRMENLLPSVFCYGSLSLKIRTLAKSMWFFFPVRSNSVYPNMRLSSHRCIVDKTDDSLSSTVHVYIMFISLFQNKVITSVKLETPIFSNTLQIKF